MIHRLPAAGTAVLLVAVALVAGAGPAAAHTHPTPVELDAPAVVQVRTDAVVNISLLVHHQSKAPPHILLYQRTYQVPLATNSGFAVDPTGAVVTTGRAVNVDLGRAAVFAVNQLFHDVYSDRAPLPRDPYSKTSLQDPPGEEPLNPMLQQCYSPNTAGDSGGCVVATTRQVRVLPFVTDQAQFGNLPAEVVYPRQGGGDVAVLRVGASSMPTVHLAAAVEGIAYSVLGFTKTPTDPSSEANLQGHFTAAGQPDIKKDKTFGMQLDALRHGVQGGPVVGEKGEVLGFLQGATDGTGAPTLIGPDKLREALAKAGVVPHAGPTDATYEQASHDYKNGLFGSAIPNLERTLQLYPGHALSSAYLADARAKAGTDADQTGKEAATSAATGGAPSSQSRGVLVPTVIGVGLLLLLALGVLLLVRRSRTVTGGDPQSDAVVAAEPVAVPAGGSRRGPQPMPNQAKAPVVGRHPQLTPSPAASPLLSVAGTDTRISRARAAAGSPSPHLAADDCRAAGPRADGSVEQPCRVCGQAADPDVEYCESCGYPPR